MNCKYHKVKQKVMLDDNNVKPIEKSMNFISNLSFTLFAS